ncbi:OXA1L isoform 9, partial [Pongo abelii]
LPGKMAMGLMCGRRELLRLLQSGRRPRAAVAHTTSSLRLPAPAASVPLPSRLQKSRFRPLLLLRQLPHPQRYLRWLLERLQM